MINDRVTIPHAEIGFTFARSAGPGGQNVNKVNSKAVLRWRPAESAALGDGVRARLLAQVGSRLTRDGDLVIASDKHREQGRNVGECLLRLKAIVAAATVRPKQRRASRPTRASKERRLSEKRANSAKKNNRRTPPEDA